LEIIPAIDLRHGKVVRLNQGDFDRQTTFSDDPLAIARGFVEDGATRIHVVDLDGTLEAAPVQNELTTEIARETPVPIEVGGGFRSAEHVAMALDASIDRIVLGTAAINDPEMVTQVLLRHGAERIVIGLDANDGKVAVKGWRETTDVDATTLMSQMYAIGVRLFAFTDIARDGTLTEPNFASVAAMIAHGIELGSGHIIASGGIGEIDHLKRLADLGAVGAIVGSAIYRGTVDLREAVRQLGANA
jgi:phosphoribosylformimino-5-aminoimidazole carboxamide ribotide isomerase